MIGLGAAVPAVARTLDTPSAPGDNGSRASFSLIVDLSDRKLYAMEDGEVAATYPVAIGQARHPTPKGSFSVRRIVWNPRWVPPDAAWARGKRAREP
ncbi:MAG TPA: L,D-transpeptidase, partial [Longimicrobium sp.]